MENTGADRAFHVRDCALVAQATGRSAQNLRELREGLLYVHPGSIYHHFWGRFLRPNFDEPEYNNDFASWAHRALHDNALAERLSVVNPAHFNSLDDLRQELIEVVEARLDESDLVPWARADQQFHFVRSKIIVFDTGIQVARPEDLVRLLPRMSSGSVFYHFIDARRRTAQRGDDFSQWLIGLGDGCGPLQERLVAVDPYFSSMAELREELAEILCGFFGGPES
jgi:hypothetical protein